MSWAENSAKRLACVVVGTAALTALTLLPAQLADAAVYEGGNAYLAYHEAGTGETWVVLLPHFHGELFAQHEYQGPKESPYTSPSVSMWEGTTEAEDRFDAAVSSTAGTVFETNGPYKGLNVWTNTGDAFAAHTSPSDREGLVAFNASETNHLWIDEGGSALDTKLPMAPSTSPSVSSEVGIAWAIAYVSSTGHLALYRQFGQKEETSVVVASGTSPAIAQQSDCECVAFQASNGHLEIYNASTHSVSDTGLSMASGSSPSAVPWEPIPMVAFNGANGHLWMYQSSSVHWDTGYAMQAGSSPSITYRWGRASMGEGSHWDVAFQAASNHYLWTYSETGGGEEWPYLMGEHSSPSISGYAAQ